MTYHSEIVPPLPPQKKKLSKGAKWAIGCGSGCLTVLILTAIAITAVSLYVKKQIAAYERELKNQGFTTVMEQQLLTITEKVHAPILYKGQLVRLLADSNCDVAILAQAAEIHGTIYGKVYFRGQALTIEPNAKVYGGIDAKASVIQNLGLIEGEITGTYQLDGAAPVPYETNIPQDTETEQP